MFWSSESGHLHKNHNVTVLIYHIVLPAKYRRSVFDSKVEAVLKDVCTELEKNYQVKFLETGTDHNHVHFLIQSVPAYSVTKIVTLIKSITAREIFKQYPEVKNILWGSKFWTDGYFASTVGKHGNENMIGRYVKNQGKVYKTLYSNHQITLL